MKKKIVALTLLALSLTACAAKETPANTHVEVKTETGYEIISFPDLRIDKGTYYDYLCIETADGNEWLLDNSEDSKYLDSNGTAIFQNGESVIVLFDIMGTLDYLEDDVILDVHSME